MATTVIDRPKGVFLVSCDHCSKPLYRVSAGRLTVTEEGAMAIQPIAIEIAGKRRVTFCSRLCAVSWMQQAPDSELKGGYPLGPF